MKKQSWKNYIPYALCLLAATAMIFLLYGGVRPISAALAAVTAGCIVAAAWLLPLLVGRGADHPSPTAGRIMDHSDTPFGGFAVFTGEDRVELTRYVRSLTDPPLAETLTLDGWESALAELTAEPEAGYTDVYRVPRGEDDRWLRITQADTAGGRIGTVVDVTGDVERSRRLAHELDYDSLTHLFSRNAFKRRVHGMITAQPEALGAMVFADLDNLKQINDAYGHKVGDQHLILAAEELSGFQELGGVVSRISGDEFAIYLHGYDSPKELMDIIRGQFAEFRQTFIMTTSGKVPVMRCSAGVALYPRDADNATDLLKLADFAMYEAKRNCKGELLEFNRESYEERNYFLDHVW